MVFAPPVGDGEAIEVSIEEMCDALADLDFDPLEEVLEELRQEFEEDAEHLDEFVDNLRENPELLDAVSRYIADDFIEEEDLDYDYYLRRFTDDLIVFLFQLWKPEEE
jgi:DNA-binding transcriptional MerR regulator